MADLQTMLNKFLASLYGGFGTGITYLPAGIVSSQFTPVSNVSTTETDLLTYTLPAGALSANGAGLRITAWGTLAANGNTKTVRVYFGASVVTTLASTNNNVAWKSTAVVTRVTATTQVAMGDTYFGALAIADGRTTSPTETLSGSLVIKVTGQSGTGSGDVTNIGLTVEVTP